MNSSKLIDRVTVVVLVGGFALFSALAISSRVLYEQTEDRLLHQRTNEALAVLTVSVSQIRSPLDAAAKLALATDGDVSAFRDAVSPSVGEGKSFTSAALFEVGDPRPIAVVGLAMSLPTAGENSADQIVSAATSEPFEVIDLLDSSDGRRLGYAVADGTSAPRFVAYGERTLSADPGVRRRTDEPFAQLDYAIYLGSEPAADHLLGASDHNLPLTGRTASGVSPFGQTELLLVMRPIGHLSSDLFANLWWIVAMFGILVSCVVAALTQRLARRRDVAIDLADDNQRLYDEQRHIAETLQISLLPEHLDVPPGVDIAARYWPAGEANLIGGDFYDSFRIDETRWGITVGDVCGKGIEAAALTGLARHTVRAVARTAVSTTEVLHAVHHAMNDHRPATYCTAAFIFLDVAPDGNVSLRVCLGGHPQPIVRRSDGTVEQIGVHGTLLGLIEPTLTEVQYELGAGDTVVIYTDGLTDAPSDQAVPLDDVMMIIGQSVGSSVGSVADSIHALQRDRRPIGSADDTALIVIGVSPDLPGRGVHDVPRTGGHAPRDEGASR